MQPQKLTAEVTAMVDSGLIPGASWSMVTARETSCWYTGVMGTVPPFDQRPVLPDALYDLASLTKVIGTTTRILQLIDEHQLTLHTPVYEALPQYPGLAMTVTDLLLHRSGLPADFDNKAGLTPTRVKEYFQAATYSGSQETTYSDLGYLLLGEIIQTLDGQTLEDSFQQYIFQPLEMYSTSYHPKELRQAIPTEQTVSRGVIQGIVHDSKGYLLGEIGSAGLFSTLHDVSQFVGSYLRNQCGAGPLFSKQLLTALQQTNHHGRTYGWLIRQGATGQPYFFHTGFTGTAVGFSFQQQKGLVLLTNRIHPVRTDNGFLARRLALYDNYF